jgi:SAM-dependent methyltransferase
MTKTSPPTACCLCGSNDGIISARFRQIYSQKDSSPVLLDWWECCVCRAWFVYPIPSVDIINRHLAMVDYNDPAAVTRIAKAKEPLQRRILKELPSWTEPGELLDFGCNYGQFLGMAREAGWKPSGFEPFLTAAETAKAGGFDVRSKWSLYEAGFTEPSFSAITAVDVFCLVWNPIATLRTMHRILKPGGVLAMRLTNKRFVLGITRAFSTPGSALDSRISRILLGQFHSIGIESLIQIVRSLGFDRIVVQPHATAAPWSGLSWRTRGAYLAADLVYVLSFATVNLSPGILFFAQKATGPSE